MFVDTTKLREIAERHFDDDARGDLDAEQWGTAMPPGDVLALIDSHERLRRAARIDRRRLADGVEPMVGQRVVIVPERAKAWGIPAHTDHVHEITSLLGNGSDGCGLVECGPTQFNVGMLQLAPPGAEVTCPHCRGWREQMARMRIDAEVYRREQIGEVHRIKAELECAKVDAERVRRLIVEACAAVGVRDDEDNACHAVQLLARAYAAAKAEVQR